MTDVEIPASLPSTKPYLVRAIWEWCNDNGFTPYLMVKVDVSCQVPREFVQDNQIILNIGAEATQGLRLQNDFITFQTRFGGIARELMIPMARVAAIYAKENNQGMAFEVEPHRGEDPEPPKPTGRHPHLQRVK
ncbi:MAG: ClpXP protease specificity-enhancing factor [Zoogloeaceae bacterium]|jgi:stringent starvation protein B|nr:ClpXP protease specificity-enhancing factor [Zoogloeaceae bacterium]